MKSLDALVIGGGPAGATAAIALARAGWSVAVFEKAVFPRRKVCGEFISATTWPVLRELGVESSLIGCAGPGVARVGFFTGESAVEAPMPGAADARRGRAIGRELLDTALLAEAKRAGAEVRQPCAVSAMRREGGAFVATLGEAHGGGYDEVRARIVIAAHGSGERDVLDRGAPREAPRASDLLGLKARFRGAKLAPGLMPLVVFPGGYGGLVHTDGGEVSFSCCIRRDVLRRVRAERGARSAGEAVLAHVRSSCLAVDEALGGATIAAPWLSAGPIRPGVRRLAHDGVFAVGNAAGEAHPLVAEGISMAIQSSWILGEVLTAHEAHGSSAARLDGIGREYARRWKEHLAPRIRAAALFAAATSRPAGARASALALASWPQLLTWGAWWSGKSRMLDALHGTG
ncbi:MAG: NAD(P)/FAD-dependent oxidoreductase [Usitatibacter sp.]